MYPHTRKYSCVYAHAYMCMGTDVYMSLCTCILGQEGVINPWMGNLPYDSASYKGQLQEY